ncbi:hypothetical protein PVAP13_7KG374201 [Panicum virgatum]|uniref:protochlorophyllide reductase n=1 Tax=Panicum virgatum TaxID=38727 RepID=A0A8T0QRB4_PANVG|nr:hypothetical protein PVAP13_7KG374201 [Panicum virgatum]
MALQAAVLPCTLSVPQKHKGNLAAVVKDTAFLTVHQKSTQKPRVPSLSVRAQAVATAPVATPGASTSTSANKKTLRQGVVVITGASSGLGLAAAKALAETGKWHVVMACRDFLKAAKAAKGAGMAEGSYTIMHLDLASLDSVRQFVDNFRRAGMPLDALVCNAAIYRPTARTPTFSADGYEMSVGVNHLGHFLLARLLLDDLRKSDYPSRRLVILGSITGNTNTLAGNIPPKASDPEKARKLWEISEKFVGLA